MTKQLNRKTLILLVSVLVAAVCLAILTALYFMVWAGPSKQDFTTAHDTANKITTLRGSTKLSEFGSAVVTEGKAGKTQEALAKAVADEKKKVQDTVNSRQELADTIADSRVLRDDEVKKAFDTYIAREKRYATYLIDYTDSFPLYYSSLKTCAVIYETNRQSNDKYADYHRQAAKNCLEDTSALAKAPLAPLAAFGKEMARIVNARQKTFDDYVAGKLSEQDTLKSIRQLSADFAKNDQTKALQDYGKNAYFNGELNALIAVLDKKIKAAK